MSYTICHNMHKSDLYWMQYLSKLILKYEEQSDCPIVSIIVIDDEIVVEAVNQVEACNDVTLHSEMICISTTCRKLQSTNLSNAILYCSHEPCPMCMEAIKLAKISRVVFGSFRLYDHSPNINIIGGVYWKYFGDILSKFFKKLR